MSSIADLLVARSKDETVGLRFEDREWTWRQVVEESLARAEMMADLRSEGPFHVGVLLENVPEYLFLLGGAALVGAVVVGINPTRRGSELGGDIAHTDCQTIVTSSDQVSLLEDLDTGVDPKRVLISDTPEYSRLVGTRSGSVSFEKVPEPSTLWLLLFTSGSTGAPKAVRVSQARIAAAGEVMVQGSGFKSDDVIYCPMPMFHGNALFTCVVPAIASGATLVLRRRFSASGFIEDVRRYRVTYFSYVGRALAHILSTPPEPDDASTPLRLGFGTDASPRDMTEFERRFGCIIVEGYGSSEGAISMSKVPGTPRNALGMPPAGTDVIIADPETSQECERAHIDEDGRLLNASLAIGEIVSREGRGKFEGYYANPEAEAARTKDGWFWSGDLGYRDEEGYFYFAGRPADWMRVDGENFAAAPVERILSRFEGVVTVAVYPVADPRTGDQVMAAIELLDDTKFDPTSFAEFLLSQSDLGTKWTPRFVRLVKRMPLTGTGKLDKRPLRNERWITDDSVWWRPPESKESRELRRNSFRLLTDEDVEAIRKEFDMSGRGDSSTFPLERLLTAWPRERDIAVAVTMLGVESFASPKPGARYPAEPGGRNTPLCDRARVRRTGPVAVHLDVTSYAALHLEALVSRLRGGRRLERRRGGFDMGLMDKVKSQATQLAEKAQQAGQAGQAKLAELQNKKKADAMLLELGGIVYQDKTGRSDPSGAARATELVGLLEQHEAQFGAVTVTSANSAIAETTGVLDPNATMPAPAATPPTASAGPIPQAQYEGEQS